MIAWALFILIVAGIALYLDNMGGEPGKPRR